MLSFFAPIGAYITPFIPEISVAFIACVLVMLGGNINQVLRKTMRNQNFILRTIAFILLNAFGYGLAIVKISPYLANWLHSLNHEILFLATISSFTLVGAWAQRNRHV